MTSDLPLPSSPDVERLVLGAILTDPECIAAALDNLTPDDFHDQRHRRILKCCIALHERGDSVDSVTIAHELIGLGFLQAVGGIGYLVQLGADMPRLSGLDGWIGVLRDKALARSAILAAQDAIRRIVAGDRASEVVESLRTLGERLNAKKPGSFQTADQVIEDSGGIEAFFTPPNGLGIETPIRWWSERMRFAPGSQTILAAMTGVGKTALALQCAVEAAKRNYRTAVYSLEMPNAANLRRMIAQESQVNMHRLALGIGTKEEIAAAGRGLRNILELENLILFRDTPVNVAAINADLQRLISLGTPAQFVIVDHLLLMESLGRSDNRAQEVSAMSRGLKLTWTRYKIAGLVLTQFNRKGTETDEPELGWLKESGSIEQDADGIGMLWCRTAEDRDSDVRDLIFKLAKNRNGPCGRIGLDFLKKYTKMTERKYENAA